MGNAILRFLRGECDDTPPAAPPHQVGFASRPHQAGFASRPHFASPANTGLATLARHLLNFDVTSQGLQIEVSGSFSWPEGVQFELHTLPVEAKLIGDGDGMTVHVKVDPRESGNVPREVQEAAIERSQARAARNYARADALHNKIISAGYRFITGPNNKEILAREYRIRLRGIDAPEMNMEYGQKARDALRKLIQGKPLAIHAYDVDQYGRVVGDVYCNGVFIQEKLLKKGCAWHYGVYDKRPAFAQWQKEARNASRGLWANPNPVAPWEHKKKERNRKNRQGPRQNKRNAQREQRVPIQAY